MNFAKKDAVRYKYNGKIGFITGRVNESNLNEKKYQVSFGNGEFIFIPENQLELIPEEENMYDLFNKGQFQGLDDLKKILYELKLSGKLTNIMYSMNNASTIFMPHQFKPVIKFLESHQEKLLIADEVGLGKTVEALYIWKELVTRRRAKRLLIIAPAVLTKKWQDDLQRYFDIQSSIVKAGELQQYIKQAQQFPHKESYALIASIESIRFSTNFNGTKRAELNQLLEEINADKTNMQKIFDCVIIDEAHYLRNKATASFKTGERLRDVSESFLLLSATPIQTTSKNLFNLLSLLAPEDFYDINIFNRMLEDNQSLVRLANEMIKPNNKDVILDCLKEAKNS
ncbi:MAG: DEAD/DEAH box helicase, partial [Treponemataceae bacterium]